MRKWTQLALAIALAFTFSASTALADQWVGYIAEQKCAEAGTYTGEAYTKCVEGKDAQTATLVLVNEADKKIYVIGNADKVKEFAGKKVTIVGKADGTTITTETCTEVTKPATEQPRNPGQPRQEGQAQPQPDRQ